MASLTSVADAIHVAYEALGIPVAVLTVVTLSIALLVRARGTDKRLSGQDAVLSEQNELLALLPAMRDEMTATRDALAVMGQEVAELRAENTRLRRPPEARRVAEEIAAAFPDWDERQRQQALRALLRAVGGG